MNPMGVHVAFKAPTSTELAHDFLWRIQRAARAGRDRHLQPVALRGRARRPRRGACSPKAVWKKRYNAHQRLRGAPRELRVHRCREAVPAHLGGGADVSGFRGSGSANPEEELGSSRPRISSKREKLGTKYMVRLQGDAWSATSTEHRTVARRAGRPQVGARRGRDRGARPGARGPRSAVARARARAARPRHPGLGIRPDSASDAGAGLSPAPASVALSIGRSLVPAATAYFFQCQRVFQRSPQATVAPGAALAAACTSSE